MSKLALPFQTRLTWESLVLEIVREGILSIQKQNSQKGMNGMVCSSLLKTVAENMVSYQPKRAPSPGGGGPHPEAQVEVEACGSGVQGQPGLLIRATHRNNVSLHTHCARCPGGCIHLTCMFLNRRVQHTAIVFVLRKFRLVQKDTNFDF